MPSVKNRYAPAPELVLGSRLNRRVPEADQKRQRTEVDEILRRLGSQPGVVLADEVGMGKTFVALGVAYSVAVRNPAGPAVIMVPANLIDKWEQDLRVFCELYLDGPVPVRVDTTEGRQKRGASKVRYGVARHSIELLKLLDDDAQIRCHVIFLAQGAMSRRQTDKWVRLALIAEALCRHGRGGASRLIQVKGQIHRFLARLLWAIGEEKAHDLGEDLWQKLLKSDPSAWKEIYNKAVHDDARKLADDPVPKAVVRVLDRVDLRDLAETLKGMPVRAVGGEERVSERVDATRTSLRGAEEQLWKKVLAGARWRSPLLVLDEAHHLKNSDTALAKQLQSADTESDLRTGDGAMSQAFDRMLFLTATPFQLSHQELVKILSRFGDVRWPEGELGPKEAFNEALSQLSSQLDESQRAAIRLRQCWSRLRPEDVDPAEETEKWWRSIQCRSHSDLNTYQRAVVEAFESAKECKSASEASLRRWVLRHNKGDRWPGTEVFRRQRFDGAAVKGKPARTGLPIPPGQLLPFFLAARSSVHHGQDLLGEALCSSFEAFRLTRENRVLAKDGSEADPAAVIALSGAAWYLDEFDRSLGKLSGAIHPKIASTAERVVDLWEKGEKVLVFAFYRYTCRALRVHISDAIERRIMSLAFQRLREHAPESEEKDVTRLIEKAQKRFFDDLDSPGRKALDRGIRGIVESQRVALDIAHVEQGEREALEDVLIRFLRVESTIARCFPLGLLDSVKPADAIRMTLESADISGVSWAEKFRGFIAFLAEQCTTDERALYLEVAQRSRTGRIRVDRDEDDAPDGKTQTTTLANVQVATGTTNRETRSRLMRAFNTPFFPDVLVCSEVMGEGVDLQRSCRHVIHHDLDWNPSTIEQRTGRIDRLGCKAEGRQPIMVYLPYLAGTADERQYQVMSEREQWFRVVMGQDEIAKLITQDSEGGVPLPAAISQELGFSLGL